MTAAWWTLLLWAIVLAGLVVRYTRDPRRRDLASRFVRNRAAVLAGVVTFVLWAVYAVATSRSLWGFAPALLVAVAVAAVYDRFRPSHG